MNTPEYPDAVDSNLVGTYPASACAGGGLVWDEVLEYRVWCHPERGAADSHDGSDYYYAFATYAEALDSSDRWSFIGGLMLARFAASSIVAISTFDDFVCRVAPIKRLNHCERRQVPFVKFLIRFVGNLFGKFGIYVFQILCREPLRPDTYVAVSPVVNAFGVKEAYGFLTA